MFDDMSRGDRRERHDEAVRDAAVAATVTATGVGFGVVYFTYKPYEESDCSAGCGAGCGVWFPLLLAYYYLVSAIRRNALGDR